MEDENRPNSASADDADTRQRLITELTQRDTWLRTLVEQTPVCISISLEGFTLYANKACLRLFGYDDLSEVIGTPQLKYVAPECRAMVVRNTRNRALGQTEPSSYEITGLRKDGVRLPLYVDVALIRVMDVPVSAAFFSDFSLKKKMEEALQAKEKLFHNLVESIDDFVGEMDMNGRCTYASSRIHDLIGYGPEDVIGKSPFDFMEPAEAERVSKLFLQYRQKRDPFYSMEHTLIHRDGTFIRAEVSGKPFIDRNGQLLGYRTITRDITKRKQIEEALIAAEKKYRNIFENAAEGIFQTLPDGRFLDANPAMARILGYNSPQELAEAVRDVGLQIHRDPAMRSEHLRTLEEQGFGRFEFQIRRKDGTVGWLFVNARVVRDAGGKTLYYEGFAKDITERKCLEEELRKANEELENRVAERTEELNKRSAKLEDLNITLRTILEQRNLDSKLLEQRVIANIDELLKPLLQTIRKARTATEREKLLDVVESSLGEIVSPFTSQLTGGKAGLTQSEMQIAHLICQGMRSKEIASVLNVSKGTIDFHRNNIRCKLGIKDRKTSLRSHLLQSGQLS